jgi:hypothetical protein
MKWQLAVTAAVAALPALVLAQGQGAAGGNQDTSAAQSATQDTTVTQSATGEMAEEKERAAPERFGFRSRQSFGLTQNQVKQLQQALRDAGCDPGAVDGIVGNQTRVAIVCVHRGKGLTTNNLNDVLRALNLGFTATDSTYDEKWANQTQVGVVNAETGQSTLGPNVKHARPTGIKGPAAGNKRTKAAARDSVTPPR